MSTRRRRPRPLLIVLGGTSSLLALVLAVPFLALGAGVGMPESSCTASSSAPPSTDETPTILGPASISAASLEVWWPASGRGQPRRLTIPITAVIDAYVEEGAAEGVRGDFAGIAHYDHVASGSGFPDARTGIRAQIQLLRKYSSGNDAVLTNPDVSPRAGASATTWGELAGRWATSTEYWAAISSIYESMKVSSATEPATLGLAPGPTCAGSGLPASGALVHDGYALPVDQIWWDQHPEWFTKPHHDYPAAKHPGPNRHKRLRHHLR